MPMSGSRASRVPAQASDTPIELTAPDRSARRTNLAPEELALFLDHKTAAVDPRYARFLLRSHLRQPPDVEVLSTAILIGVPRRFDEFRIVEQPDVAPRFASDNHASTTVSTVTTQPVATQADSANDRCTAHPDDGEHAPSLALTSYTTPKPHSREGPVRIRRVSNGKAYGLLGYRYDPVLVPGPGLRGLQQRRAPKKLISLDIEQRPRDAPRKHKRRMFDTEVALFDLITFIDADRRIHTWLATMTSRVSNHRFHGRLSEKRALEFCLAGLAQDVTSDALTWGLNDGKWVRQTIHSFPGGADGAK